MRDEPQPRAGKADASEVDRAYLKTNHFTRAPVDASVLQPADVARRQQFWLTIHVPATAQAGLYHGTVTITAKNAPDRILTLELRVPGFELPSRDSSTRSTIPPGWKATCRSTTRRDMRVLTANEYLADPAEKAAHGCRNPVVYPQPRANADGSVDFRQLDVA